MKFLVRNSKTGETRPIVISPAIAYRDMDAEKSWCVGPCQCPMECDGDCENGWPSRAEVPAILEMMDR